MSEIVNRVTRYLNSASHVLQLPIAEAMITYKEKRYSRYANSNLLIILTFRSIFSGMKSSQSELSEEYLQKKKNVS